MKIKTFYINNQINFVFSLLAGLLFCIGLVGVFFDPIYSYLLISGATWGLFCIYYSLNKNTNLLEPINFIFLAVFGGTVCRLIYMFVFPDRPNVTEFLLLGRGIQIAINGGILNILGLAVMMVGYVVGMRVTKFSKWKKGFFTISFFKKGKRLLPVLLGLLFLSAIGLFIFYKIFGVQFFTSFTKKYELVSDDQGQLSRTSLGIPRDLLMQGKTAFLIYITWFYAKGKKIMSWHGILLVFFFIVGNAPNLFLSSRLPIIWDIFYWMMLSLMFQKKRKFPWVKVTSGFVVVALVIVIIGVLRQAGKNISEEDLSITGDSFVDKIFGNRNLLSADKTGILYDAVEKNKYQFEYGLSFIDFFLAPIPKSIWVNKPITAIETRIQPLFIGPLGGSGSVPPGLPAEGYLQFGFIGLIGLMFCYGYFMAYMFNIFNNSVQSYSFLLYFFFCYHFGFDMIGFSVGTAAVQFLIDFLPLYFVLKFLK